MQIGWFCLVMTLKSMHHFTIRAAFYWAFLDISEHLKVSSIVA